MRTFNVILIASLYSTLIAVGFYLGGLVAALKIACLCVLFTVGLVLWVQKGANHEQN